MYECQVCLNDDSDDLKCTECWGTRIVLPPGTDLPQLGAILLREMRKPRTHTPPSAIRETTRGRLAKACDALEAGKPDPTDEEAVEKLLDGIRAIQSLDDLGCVELNRLLMVVEQQLWSWHNE
jgi:hypothetical protein